MVEREQFVPLLVEQDEEILEELRDIRIACGESGGLARIDCVVRVPTGDRLRVVDGSEQA